MPDMQKGSLLGPKYTDEEILEMLKKYNAEYTKHETEEETEEEE